jgi:hypothetical protein
MRAHSTADVIGQSFNSFFDNMSPGDDDYSDNYSELISSEWVVTDRINAETGRNFTSWAEYFGPRQVDGNSFTLTQQYNLSSEVFDDDNLAIDWPSDVFNTSAPKESFPWAAKDIIIVSQIHPSFTLRTNAEIAYRRPMLICMLLLRGTDDTTKRCAYRRRRRST